MVPSLPTPEGPEGGDPMTQSIQIRSIEDLLSNPDLLRQLIRDFPGQVLSSRKIRVWIIRNFGFYLDEHLERSLAHQLSLILMQMHGQGEIVIYKKSTNWGYPTKYVWKR